MTTSTFVALRTETIGVAVPSVTFNLAEVSGYTHLMIVAQTRQSVSLSYTGLQLNDATTGYSQTMMAGNGSTPFSNRSSNAPKIYPLFGTYESTSNPLVTTYTIPSYSNPNTNKTVLCRAGDSSAIAQANVGTWRSNAPITSVTIGTQSDSGSTGTFAVGSTFTVYGIASANAFAKATGGIIAEDETYWYHVFGANGTFTPKQSLSADVLVVAGGGGGGSGGGGGGGAGGLLAFSNQALTAGTYAVTVGAGGPGGAQGSNAKGTNGVNSQFAALTAAVGGGGGGGYSGSGNSAAIGGSGGGAGGSTGGGASGTGAAGTTGQGFAGGNGGGSDGGAGGGGGAGAVGTNGTSGASANGGNGGIGATSTLINTIGAATGLGQGVAQTYYIAAGGGGGAYTSGGSNGGIGGGGTGGVTAAATVSGRSNSGSGGGGGGAGSSWAGSAGGSGVVVVRYAK